MKQLGRVLAIGIVVTALSACGGGNDSSTAPATPQRGDLIENPPKKVATYAPSDLLRVLGGSDTGKTLLQLTTSPKCAITVYHLTYRTVDATGNLIPASGALMVPGGTDASCTGARPLVLYGHGTATDRNFDISKLDAPDNAEGVVLAAVFAAQGYIVVAPNYAGYDTSTLDYHPYLIADQQSKDMIDSLIAARAALPTADAPGSSDNGKLFITGYSQGGYVAMATHSAMQTAGLAVTASAPMSGPYALSAFGDALFEGQANKSATVNLALLSVAYQHAYGDIYAMPEAEFEGKYAASIEALLPGTTTLADLQSQGRFPSALFSNTPPTAAYAIYTPATTPAYLAGVFAAGFGPDHLITNSYREAYLNDALSAPDGGFPTLSDGLPPASPKQSLRVHLKANDLRNWGPSAPTLLCGGNSDPTVFFFNTTLMQHYWTTHPPDSTPVFLDIDSAASSGDPYGTLKTAFGVAKDLVRTQAVLGGATDGGDAAVLDSYHAVLVAPFCLSAAKSFFDAH